MNYTEVTTNYQYMLCFLNKTKKENWLKRIFSGLFILLIPLLVTAQTDVKGESFFELTQKRFYYDSTGKVDLPQVLKKDTPWATSYTTAKKGALWVSFLLKNKADKPQQVIIPVGNVPTAFLFSSESRMAHGTGLFLPIEHRTYQHHTVAFKVNLPPNTKINFLLQLKTENKMALPKEFNPVIRSASTQQLEDNKRLFTQGLFIGIILVMALYNFLLYISVRDISYLYYVLSILGIGLYFAFYYGFTVQYLWKELPAWDTYSFAIIVPCTGLARIMFTKTYLHTRQLLPKIDFFLNSLLVLYLVPIGMGLAAYLFGLPWYDIVIDVIGVLGTMVLVSMLVASILTYMKGYTPALFFIVANLLFVLGANAFIIKEMGLYEDNFFSRYAVQLGVIAQVVLFSLGLAYRLKKARQEAAEQTLAKERLQREQEVEKKLLIEKQKAELEQKVQERTLELHKSIQKLQESETGLKKLNKIKDKLFSVVSHDLRGPVATLDSFISIITNHAAKITQDELVLLSGKTRQSVNNLSFLLDNLLNWSRSQMGTLAYNPESFCLYDIIQKNIDLYKPNAESKKITIISNVKKEAFVVADKSMIDFIIRNLLSNAIKFTNTFGSIKLSAQIEEEHILFSVIDSGVGMPPDQLRKIMEPESTFSTRGTAKEQGTGLGLLLCKEFLDKHEAHLEVLSKPGEGSTFSFKLKKSKETLVVREVF